MLTLSDTGLPGITCGRCGEPVPLDTAVAVKFSKFGLSVQFVCIDCAEKLKELYPEADFLLARTYFEALLAPGRPRRILRPGS